MYPDSPNHIFALKSGDHERRTALPHPTGSLP
jgi:hypothetical protein